MCLFGCFMFLLFHSSKDANIKRLRPVLFIIFSFSCFSFVLFSFFVCVFMVIFSRYFFCIISNGGKNVWKWRRRMSEGEQKKICFVWRGRWKKKIFELKNDEIWHESFWALFGTWLFAAASCLRLSTFSTTHSSNYNV